MASVREERRLTFAKTPPRSETAKGITAGVISALRLPLCLPAQPQAFLGHGKRAPTRLGFRLGVDLLGHLGFFDLSGLDQAVELQVHRAMNDEE